MAIASDLIGKVLCTQIGGKQCKGIIVETEAYAGITDKASHAYNGKRTPRTEIMYHSGGVSYVYLCYGIHHLFNIVTNIQGTPHAALIRAIEPIDGIHFMQERHAIEHQSFKLGNGPGNLSKSLGISIAHTGVDLTGELIWLEDHGFSYTPQDIVASPRVGVAYAKEDALLPYRFRLKGSRWTSPQK